jgi:D-proline reductase (dithiol) PrdB
MQLDQGGPRPPESDIPNSWHASGGLERKTARQYRVGVPKLEQLSEIERQAILNFPFMGHDASPGATLSKPLSDAKVALVTTAGIHLRGDTPFTSGDPTFRVIASNTGADQIVQSHTSIGFDRIPTYRDINVCFPIDRLRELVEQGKIGSVTDDFYSFLGAQRDPRRIVGETAPEVARALTSAGTDVVVLTPT